MERRALLTYLDLSPAPDAVSALTARLGAGQAVALQRSFVRAETARALQTRPLLTPVGLVHPPGGLTEALALIDRRLPLWAADGADEGERIAGAVERAFRGGAGLVIVMRPGFPDLPLSFLLSAARLLEKYDLVLGPAGSGFYSLIGLRLPAPELFVGLDWTRDRILHTTVRRANMAGLSIVYVPGWRGVSSADDLIRLHDRLRHASAPPELAAAVDRALNVMTPAGSGET